MQKCRSADECAAFRSVGDRSDAALRSVDECAACMGTLFSPSVGASLVDAR